MVRTAHPSSNILPPRNIRARRCSPNHFVLETLDSHNALRAFTFAAPSFASRKERAFAFAPVGRDAAEVCDAEVSGSISREESFEIGVRRSQRPNWRRVMSECVNASLRCEGPEPWKEH